MIDDDDDDDADDDDIDYDIDECKVKGEAGSEPIEIKSNRKELIEEDEVKVRIYCKIVLWPVNSEILNFFNLINSD